MSKKVRRVIGKIERESLRKQRNSRRIELFPTVIKNTNYKSLKVLILELLHKNIRNYTLKEEIDRKTNYKSFKSLTPLTKGRDKDRIFLHV